MTARDRTSEILEIKQRVNNKMSFASSNLSSLHRQWTENRVSRACTPDFYIVRAVTIIEVFARRNIAELIDHSKQFTDRAVSLARQIKMDFELVRDIQGRAITLGDIVAHSVSINTFGQVLTCFDTLLGGQVRPLLMKAVDEFDAMMANRPPAPIIDDFDTLARTLTRLFEVRHILCHEMPSNSIYDELEIDDFLNAAIEFSQALEEVLSFEKFGDLPRDQTSMTIAAGVRLKEKEAELDVVLSDVRLRLEHDPGVILLSSDDGKVQELGARQSVELGLFMESQEKWLAYRKAFCDFAYGSKEGTVWPMLWGQKAAEMTEVRTAELKSWLESLPQ
jgi:hypothetical protein